MRNLFSSVDLNTQQFSDLNSRKCLHDWVWTCHSLFVYYPFKLVMERRSHLSGLPSVLSFDLLQTALVKLHINIYGATVTTVLKVYLAPTDAVSDSHWILKWKTNSFHEMNVLNRGWFQCHVGPAERSWAPCTWPKGGLRTLLSDDQAQHQQAIVCVCSPCSSQHHRSRLFPPSRPQFSVFQWGSSMPSFPFLFCKPSEVRSFHETLISKDNWKEKCATLNWPCSWSFRLLYTERSIHILSVFSCCIFANVVTLPFLTSVSVVFLERGAPSSVSVNHSAAVVERESFPLDFEFSQLMFPP